MIPHVFSFHDVNEAYYEIHTVKHHFTVSEDTRNGHAWVFPAPVIIANLMPERRVLFDPVRDANPFFHYMEAIWMMAGSRGVSFPSLFAKNLLNYSDDGMSLHGAYGYRWRTHFATNQIDRVIGLLQADPLSRRAVIAMWDPEVDWKENAKDLPCNTHVYFRVMKGELSMTVCNRSNDLVWGALGANVVHMSLLQEYVAEALALPIGPYYQFTNNLHIYEGWERKFGPPVRWYRANPNYKSIKWGPDTLDINEAASFVTNDLTYDYSSDVLRLNAVPMFKAWHAHKAKNYEAAAAEALLIYDDDWREACLKWLERRADNVAETQEG